MVLLRRLLGFACPGGPSSKGSARSLVFEATEKNIEHPWPSSPVPATTVKQRPSASAEAAPRVHLARGAVWILVLGLLLGSLGGGLLGIMSVNGSSRGGEPVSVGAESPGRLPNLGPPSA